MSLFIPDANCYIQCIRESFIILTGYFIWIKFNICHFGSDLYIGQSLPVYNFDLNGYIWIITGAFKTKIETVRICSSCFRCTNDPCMMQFLTELFQIRIQIWHNSTWAGFQHVIVNCYIQMVLFWRSWKKFNNHANSAGPEKSTTHLVYTFIFHSCWDF